MSDNKISVNDADFNLICEYFSATDRQGPGSDETTMRAMQLLTDLPACPHIADLGCGTGSSALLLAKQTEGHVTALDLFPEFIGKLKSRAEKENVSDKITAIVGSMEALPFDETSLDLIWSEGAIYNIGFQHGLQEWYRFIKPNGYIAVTEISWITNERPKEIEGYWQETYPEIDTVSNKIKQMEQAGYRTIDTFVLPENCWTENFYQPQQKARQLFLKRHNNNPAAQNLINDLQKEILLYDKYKEYYGYVFYIGQKQEDSKRYPH